MQCSLCKSKLAETFLKKVKGTYIKNANGKLFTICFACQQKFRTKEELLKQMAR